MKKPKKKSVRKPRKAADAAHRRVDNAQTPEELLAALPEAHAEHSRQVKDLANRFIDAIEETNYHPTVALDAMQKLLSIGIGKAMGENQKELWDMFVSQYYEEVRMISLIEMFEGMQEFNTRVEESGVLEPEAPTPTEVSDESKN